jgi:hypothetical protein
MLGRREHGTPDQVALPQALAKQPSVQLPAGGERKPAYKDSGPNCKPQELFASAPLPKFVIHGGTR